MFNNRDNSMLQFEYKFLVVHFIDLEYYASVLAVDGTKLTEPEPLQSYLAVLGIGGWEMIDIVPSTNEVDTTIKMFFKRQISK